MALPIQARPASISMPRPSSPKKTGRLSFPAFCLFASIEKPNTILADLFMPFRFGDLSSAVRASLRSCLNDEIDDGLAHGRQARLRRWTVDSFFSVPLVRDGDTGGMRKRSWS